MLTVACVAVGDYEGCGDRYVETLRAMVARNLSRSYEFVCLRPEGLAGWWAKVALFKPGQFAGRVLYVDLDSVITGSLDELVEHKGIIHLAQWGWTKNDYGSGVMVWDAGEHAEIWERYTDDVPQRFRGDQDWLTHLGGWDALPEGMTRSYKYHCRDRVPEGCAICCMHGPVKPHTIKTGWVPGMWWA